MQTTLRDNGVILNIFAVVVLLATVFLGNILKIDAQFFFSITFILISVLAFGTSILVVTRLENTLKGLESNFSEQQRSVNEIATMKNIVDIQKEEALEMEKRLKKVSWLRTKKEYQDFERSDQTLEVWVLAFDFRYEVNEFSDIVIENLLKGKRYTYIFPPHLRHHLRQLLMLWRNANITDIIIGTQVRFIELSNDIVPLNEAIYNPAPDGEKQRITKAIIMTPEVELEYFIELNLEQTGRMVEKFLNLMKEGTTVTLSDIIAQSKKHYFPNDRGIHEE